MAKRIIISRTDRIGDLVLSIPAFIMVRKMFPDSDITVLVRRYNADIVQNLPGMDRSISIDDYSEQDLQTKIQDLKPEVFIALYSNPAVGKLARKSGAKIRIGPLSKWHSFRSYNKGVFQKRSRSTKNEAAYNLDLVKALDPARFDTLYEVYTKVHYKPNHAKWTQNWMTRHQIQHPFVIIHPLTGGSAKNIKPESYARLIEQLRKSFPSVGVVVTAGPDEKENVQRLVDKIKDEQVQVFHNVGSILRLAALIDQCTMFVGASTGPTHIAGALKKPMVGIYPAKNTQSPTRWGAFDNPHASYFVVDENNPSENYKAAYFDQFTPGLETELHRLVETILEKSLGERGK